MPPARTKERAAGRAATASRRRRTQAAAISSVASPAASPMAGEDAFAHRGTLLGEGHLDALPVAGRRRRVLKAVDLRAAARGSSGRPSRAVAGTHAGHRAGGGVAGEAQPVVHEQEQPYCPFSTDLV